MILISACLLGCACRYDGKSKPHPLAQELARQGLAVPVCPEQLGGLPTPRAPSERQGERVVSSLGADVTAQYRRGAEEALRLAELYGCTTAVLKERSPSCGSGAIYDGTFHRYGDGGLGHGGGTAAAARRPRTGRESAGKPAGRIGQYTIADTFRRRAARRASRDFHKKRRIFYVRFVKNTKND